MATRSRTKLLAELLAPSPVDLPLPVGAHSSTRVADTRVPNARTLEVGVCSINAESLLTLYIAANSEEEWFEQARVAAEFAAFSSHHLRHAAFEGVKRVPASEPPGEEQAAEEATQLEDFAATDTLNEDPPQKVASPRKAERKRTSRALRTPEAPDSSATARMAQAARSTWNPADNSLARGFLQAEGHSTPEAHTHAEGRSTPKTCAHAEGCSAPKTPAQGCKRKRGTKSSTSYRHGRNRRWAESAVEAESELHRQARLLGRAFANSEMLIGGSYSILRDGSVSSTGWQGRRLPAAKREAVLRRYDSGEILQDLATFQPIHYRPESACATFLLDCEHRAFLYRTSQAAWLLPAGKIQELGTAIEFLLGSELRSRAMEEQCRGGDRGNHLPCIIGHQRQYTQIPTLTTWHRDHAERVNHFLALPIIRRLNAWASSVVQLIFPGIAKRFLESANWHSSQNKIEPLFPLFWNLCINASFPGHHRVHTKPHADSKNPVGVCVLLAYVLPGYKFNHRKRSWLVLWEAGVIIELPPWVLVAYPSSLFLHFNIDIQDIQFVTTEGDDRPTPENSTPISEGDDEGRGSMLWFNQATMYQASETGFGSVKSAMAAGHPGTTDYGKDAQQAFQSCAVFKGLDE